MSFLTAVDLRAATDIISCHVSMPGILMFVAIDTFVGIIKKKIKIMNY